MTSRLKNIITLLGAASLFSISSQVSAQEGQKNVYHEPLIYAGYDDIESKDGSLEEKKGAKKDKYTLPLESSRKIEFETSEGTWLSLDMSPDSSTIIFELLGDLYTIPTSGGDATLFMGGMAFDSQPVYSPDGSKIAFLSDRDGSEGVWLVNTDGTEPKKLNSSGNGYVSPAWSNDGNYVMVSQGAPGLGAYELWMHHINGGSGVQLTKAMPTPTTPRNQSHNALGVQASPDGKYLYYAQKSGGFQYNMTGFSWGIARRTLADGQEDKIIEAYGGAIRPLISPDGTKLVYGTRHDSQTGLRVRDLNTGEDNWLIYPITRDDQESRATRDLLPSYTFTPDGSALIMNLNGGIARVEMTTGEATDIPFTAKVSQDIGPSLHFDLKDPSGSIEARLIQSPKQSPDGKSIVFSSLTNLYTMDLEKGEPKRFNSGDTPEFQPSYSPDGQWITYVTWDVDGGHVWKKRSNGRGRAIQLTKLAGYYHSPIFTPDGKGVFSFRASHYDRMMGDKNGSPFGGGGGADIIRIPAEGGDASLLSYARGASTPHYGPEANRLYLYSRGGLISINFEGKDLTTHLKVVGPPGMGGSQPTPANDVQISPDGKYAMASIRNQLYVLNVPRIGGEAQTINVNASSVPIKQISDVGADYFEWVDDGKTLTWAVGSTFYRQAMETISFKEEEKEDPSKEISKEGEEAKKEAEEPKLYTSFRAKVTVDRDIPNSKILLTGATVFTMRGGMEVLENADVLVEGNRVSAVGSTGSLELPEGTITMDFRGKFITPGFIDPHAHWFDFHRGILDTQHWDFIANVAYGVTAGLDVQTSTNDMFAYQDMIDSGRMIGPRGYSTGPGIFSSNAFSSKEDAIGVLKKYRDHYRTNNIKAYVSGNRKQRQYVIQASEELGMMPTTEGALDLKLDLTHIIDGFSGNEHSYPIHPFYNDVVQFTAQSGTSYNPTLLVNYGGPWTEEYFFTHEETHDDEKVRRFLPHNYVDAKTMRRQWFRESEYIFPQVAKGVKDILRAGGRVGFGSHGQYQGLGYHWAMWAMSAGGASSIEILNIATLKGAEVIGRASEIGSLEPGKYADLVILDKDPRVNIRNTTSISKVMKNGRIYDGRTMDQIFPDQKPLPKQWFWDKEPK
ncbi:MAG: amidohydrolase family protein [Sphingomonadales bacterium]